MGKHGWYRPKSNNIPKGTHIKHTYVFDSDFSSFFQKLQKSQFRLPNSYRENERKKNVWQMNIDFFHSSNKIHHFNHKK